MRYLFVTWDGGGNLHCVLPLAERLLKRGHQVGFLGHRGQRRTIEARGLSFAALRRAPDPASASAAALIDDWRLSPLAAATLYRDRLLIGPAALYAADLLTEIERQRPDAIAVDFFLFGALAAAERSGLPTAALWHTVYAPPAVKVPPFSLGRGFPKGRTARLGQGALRALQAAWWKRSLPSLNATRAGIGLSPLADPFEQYDRLARVLVLSSAAFDFAALCGAALPANVRYVGPQIAEGASAPPRAPERDPPLVLVSFSTTYQAQEQLLQRTVNALGTLPVRALVTTGPAVSLNAQPPVNVEIRPWVEHSDLLPQTALVLSHAGHGTVTRSLSHGVPLICIPMGRDQPCVAARVVHSGAGLRLRRDPSEREIAGAVAHALAEPALKYNARRLQERFLDEIAAERAVGEMEELGEARAAPGELT